MNGVDMFWLAGMEWYGGVEMNLTSTPSYLRCVLRAVPVTFTHTHVWR